MEEEPRDNCQVDCGQIESVEFNPNQQDPIYHSGQEEIVQVVYQSNNTGSLVGVESSLLTRDSFQASDQLSNRALQNRYNDQIGDLDCSDRDNSSLRATSTLPSVAEESGSGIGATYRNEQDPLVRLDTQSSEDRSLEFSLVPDASRSLLAGGYDSYRPPHYNDLSEPDLIDDAQAIYSIVNKQQTKDISGPDNEANYQHNPLKSPQFEQRAEDYNHYNQNQAGTSVNTEIPLDTQPADYLEAGQSLDVRNKTPENESKLVDINDENKGSEEINAEICEIITRQKQGAAESGSLRSKFKKRLVASISTNENDLTAHRQKLIDAQDLNSIECHDESIGDLPKFKRNPSVSFNVRASGAGRHSVDIRNLPSYLTVKRASIVDVAKGAMSTLIHSFGSGTGSNISSARKDSVFDDEPIFEEPIAPTLSLGQRVALVKNDGSEFGTVGWIGQLPDVDDDWIVGVIFDNMIGNCDGAYNGVRYFYARENYAMFVPLSSLTKTDNYIGRPETGTMLSRMSVSLRPGQLISIQRSSIRLQHCFLNAPHQRVGHDVRAVSNRLHCQCHNCGPCAHLTKQHSRVNAMPAFGAHHAINKKNSLAHAAVEILAHHHHHYHEEEHEEEEYQFGDNAAHACNFVRYSCCQQNGSSGHEFSADCGMVRPELLDNLIHAPRAPHRRTRLRQTRNCQIDQQTREPANNILAISGQDLITDERFSTANEGSILEDGGSSCSSYSSHSLSGEAENVPFNQNTDNYQMDSMNYFQGSTVYNTIDSKISLQDQQRFIYQRESTSYHPAQSNDGSVDLDQQARGFIPRLRKCFGCLVKRDGQRRRPKKRKLSARNRLIEFRRKQSVFVPSTLAKPQEDFASHGIVLAPWESRNQGYNSDYSSYSRSSGSSRSSPTNSPRRQKPAGYDITHQLLHNQQQESIMIDHKITASNEQLKSSQTNKLLSYDDYTFSDCYRSYEKNAHSYESDLGYYDATADSSNDNLKNIVDHAINEEVRVQELAPGMIESISPIQSSTASYSDHIDISSPTASTLDHENPQDLCARIDKINLDNDTDSSRS